MYCCVPLRLFVKRHILLCIAFMYIDVDVSGVVRVHAVSVVGIVVLYVLSPIQRLLHLFAQQFGFVLHLCFRTVAANAFA